MNKYVVTNCIVGSVLIASFSYAIGYSVGKKKYQNILSRILVKYIPKDFI